VSFLTHVVLLVNLKPESVDMRNLYSLRIGIHYIAVISDLMVCRIYTVYILYITAYLMVWLSSKSILSNTRIN